MFLKLGDRLINLDRVERIDLGADGATFTMASGSKLDVKSAAEADELRALVEEATTGSVLGRLAVYRAEPGFMEWRRSRPEEARVAP